MDTFGRSRNGCGLLCLSLLTMSGVLGCGKSDGPKRVPVRGKVEREGKPVTAAGISFLPAEGVQGPAANGAILDGKYYLTAETGPVAGNHHVRITLPPMKGGPARGSSSSAAGSMKHKSQWNFDVLVPLGDTFEKDFVLD